MNSAIFINNILNKNIKLYSYEIDSDYENKILFKLKKKVEGKCTKNGYINKNSVKIIKLSTPKIIAEHFSCDIVFDVLYSSDICNPTEGTIIKAKVHNINNMGILAVVEENKEIIISIIIPKEHTIEKKEKELYNTIKENNEISVQILGKKNELNETRINIIGRLVDKNDIEKISFNKNKVYLENTLNENDDEDDEEYEDEDKDEDDLYDEEDESDNNEENDEYEENKEDNEEETILDEEEDEVDDDDIEEDDDNEEYVEHDND